jgi:hypothetical protein
MAIKDIIAEITERPFITHEAPQPQKKVKPTPQEVQAQFEKAQAMLKELFE